MDKPHSVEERITRLLDQEQIKNVIFRYCRAADRFDAAEFASLFWDDGNFIGGPYEGKAADFRLQAFEESARHRLEVTTHHSTNIIIEQLGATMARVESYALVFLVAQTAEEALNQETDNAPANHPRARTKTMTVYSMRYLDRFEKRDEEWRIAERRIVPDWNDASPYMGTIEGGLLDRLQLRSARDRSDPLYHLDD